MSVLGFSHIVTEVKDISHAVSCYRKLGYELEYTMEQIVPPEKMSVLDDQPSQVKLLYLRHTKQPCLGVELIQHDKHGPRQKTKTICYGYTQQESERRTVIDPEGNKIVLFEENLSECHQHIFIPTEKLDDTQRFYQEIFHLVQKPDENKFCSTYADLYGEVRRSTILALSQCLSPNWNVLLHLVETTDVGLIRHLNHYGFSCFCFLIDREEYSLYQKKKMKIAGPIEDQKDVDGKTSHFQIGFLKDPNGFLIEFYLSRSVTDSKEEKVSRHV